MIDRIESTPEPGSFDLSEYDFLDFGCSGGGSMTFARDHFSAKRGLGLDIDQNKIAATKAAGFEAAYADLSVPIEYLGKSRFAIMSHFLEHVPSPDIAGKIIETACLASTDFVFIRLPWFDSDGPLAQMKLKCFWSDWGGHTNHMTSAELYLILLRLRQRGLVYGFRIFGHVPVANANADCLIPLDAPVNQHHHNESLHGPKGAGALPFPCFRELIAMVAISENTDPDPPSILAKRQLLLQSN